jgi:hypothetical protein
MAELEILKDVLAALGAMNVYVKVIIILTGLPIMYLGRKVAVDKDFRADVIAILNSITGKRNLGLPDHQLFKSKSIYNTYIANIDFDSDIKNVIFKIILKEKTDVVIQMATEYVSKYKESKIPVDCTMFELTDAMVLAYETKIKDNFDKTYKEDADVLYKFVYYDRFKPYHNKNILFILTAIRSFSNSRLSDEQKVYMYLNLIYTALELAILDCERVFDEINGQLKTYNDKWHKTQ